MSAFRLDILIYTQRLPAGLEDANEESRDIGGGGCDAVDSTHSSIGVSPEPSSRIDRTFRRSWADAVFRSRLTSIH